MRIFTGVVVSGFCLEVAHEYHPSVSIGTVLCTGNMEFYLTNPYLFDDYLKEKEAMVSDHGAKQWDFHTCLTKKIKENVFQLGITLLSLANLYTDEEYFKGDGSGVVNLETLTRSLDETSKIYSNSFVELIRSILAARNIDGLPTWASLVKTFKLQRHVPAELKSLMDKACDVGNVQSKKVDDSIDLGCGVFCMPAIDRSKSKPKRAGVGAHGEKDQNYLMQSSAGLVKRSAMKNFDSARSSIFDAGYRSVKESGYSANEWGHGQGGSGKKSIKHMVFNGDGFSDSGYAPTEQSIDSNVEFLHDLKDSAKFSRDNECGALYYDLDEIRSGHRGNFNKQSQVSLNNNSFIRDLSNRRSAEKSRSPQRHDWEHPTKVISHYDRNRVSVSPEREKSKGLGLRSTAKDHERGDSRADEFPNGIFAEYPSFSNGYR